MTRNNDDVTPSENEDELPGISSFTLQTRERNISASAYNTHQLIAELEGAVTRMGWPTPDRWRPDGGVVAKFRALDRVRTVYVRPGPGECAVDAILRVLVSEFGIDPILMQCKSLSVLLDEEVVDAD
jgi:hypothetical protein